MSAEPLYRADQQTPAHHLRYAWTCWSSGARFENLSPPEILSGLAAGWEAD